MSRTGRHRGHPPWKSPRCDSLSLLRGAADTITTKIFEPQRSCSFWLTRVRSIF